jgi:hypothetical protein
MTKTHAEFLEELKKYIYKKIEIEKIPIGEDYLNSTIIELEVIANKIKQFQAEQKQPHEAKFLDDLTDSEAESLDY